MLLNAICSNSNGYLFFWLILFPLLLCVGTMLMFRKDTYSTAMEKWILFLMLIGMLLMIGFLPTLSFLTLTELLKVFLKEQKNKEQNTKEKETRV